MYFPGESLSVFCGEADYRVAAPQHTGFGEAGQQVPLDVRCKRGARLLVISFVERLLRLTVGPRESVKERPRHRPHSISQRVVLSMRSDTSRELRRTDDESLSESAGFGEREDWVPTAKRLSGR